MDKFAPSGVYCAMITPFDGNGGIAFGQVEKIVEFLIQKNVDGVFPVSNVGEFLVLKKEQKKELIRTVINAGKGKIAITPGITDLDIRETLEIAEFCAKEGCDAVVVSAPYYYAHTDAYIKAYLKSTADNSPLPVCLYNSPSFANKISTDTILELAAHPNIVAIKESSGDIKFLTALIDSIKRQGSKVNVMVGWEELLFTALNLGGVGCVVSSGGIVPEILKEIINSRKSGNMDRALCLQRAVCRITSEIGKYGFPQGYKLAVRARGFDFSIYPTQHFSAEENELLSHQTQLEAIINKELAAL